MWPGAALGWVRVLVCGDGSAVQNKCSMMMCVVGPCFQRVRYRHEYFNDKLYGSLLQLSQFAWRLAPRAAVCARRPVTGVSRDRNSKISISRENDYKRKPVGMNITRRPPQGLERQGRTGGYSYQRDCYKRERSLHAPDQKPDTVHENKHVSLRPRS